MRATLSRCVALALVASALAVAAPAPGTADAAVISNSGGSRRNGWYPDQTSLTPALVSGGTFGQLFSTPIIGQVYAQPLVVNGVVFVATEANWIYGIDAVTGAVLWSRNVGTPFDPQDVACSDLLPTVGITGTPAIDDVTGTAYFVAKSYVNGSGGATQWRMHSVDVATGAERSGFPVTIQGNAQNNPLQPFTPTTQHQRPGLLLMDGVVYAAFGGHCDAPPFRGWIAGVSTSGQLRALFSTRAGDATASGNGIWHSGQGLVSDRPGSIVFATGNAFGNGTPASAIPGSQPPADLGQSVVRVGVQADGSLRATDFFTPFDAPTMDETDADLGSGGPISLPPEYFGTPSIPNLILEIGKQGYLYVLDADNLGGSRQGPGQGDLVVNRLGPLAGVWGRPGVWPGDGGYIYIPYTFGTMGALRYGLDGNGRPTFSQAGSSTDQFGYGSSAPVITSSGAASGSALVWVVWQGSGNAQLRAYDPVPVNGVLRLRYSASVGQAAKFTPPGVGGNRVYVGTADGHLLGFGAPVNPAVTAPAVSFAPTVIGQSSTVTATLTASGAVTVSAIGRTGSAYTLGTPSRSLPASLTTGQTITVPVTFAPSVTGAIAGSIDVTTSAGVVKVPLSGTGLATQGLLESSPVLLSFGGAPVGGQLTGTVRFSNAGGTPVVVQGVTLPAAPFSASALPPVGSSIPPGGSVLVNVSFAPTVVGQFVDDVTIQSDGGTATVPLSGSAAEPGVLTVSPLSLDFGTVPVGAARTQTVTVRNTGGSTLVVTKSKPPASSSFRALTSLAEGTAIGAGQSVQLDVSFTPQVAGVVTDTWILNADQPGSVLQTVTFTGQGTPAQGAVIPDPTAGGWQLNGAAALLGTTTGSRLALTPNEPVTAGSAFWPSAVATSTLNAAFDLSIGGGTGADGLTFVLADPTRGATPTSIGGPGGGLGVDAIPGLAVAFVTYPSDRVGIVRTGTGVYPDWIVSTTAVPPLRTGVHRIEVGVQSGTVTISMDGAVVLTSVASPPANALVGFTAGTGGAYDQHAVANVLVTAVGVPATISVSPSPLTFDPVVAGQQGTRTLTISNTGGSPLTLGTLTPPVAPFSTSGFPASGTVVPAGQSVSGVVTFSPPATGDFTGSLSLSSSAGTATVPLAGAGTAPSPGVLSVTPTTVDFGSVAVGSSATATISIANTGQSVLAVSGVTAPAGAITVSGLPAVGTSVAPGQVLQATARFSPSTLGAATASLTVTSTVGSATVSLGGTGTAPSPGALSVTPATLAFGTVATGSSDARTVTIANVGGSPLTIGAVSPPAAPYTVTGLPISGAVLAAGASVVATVTYAPTAAGATTGTLTVDSSVGTATVSMSGTAVVGVVIGDPAAGGWQLNGTASLLGTTPGSLLQLTPATGGAAGSAFWPTSVASAAVTASFDLTIAGGNVGADGATFMLADVARGATPTSLGSAGGGLGSSGIPGLAVTFVTYPSDLVGISLVTTGSFPNYLVSTAAVPPLRAGVRRVVVTAASGTVTVSIDGTTVLSRAATLPANVLAGFTAGTGGFTQQHAVSNVRITATTSPPILTATPTALAFGTVTVGTSTPRTVTITNTGATTLRVTGRTVPSAPFTVSGWPANNATIAAGASVTATVTYAPTAAGSSSANLSLTTASGSVAVALSGTAATAGALTVSPSTLSFGSVTTGSTASQTVTITNTGGSALTISSTVPPVAPFTVTGLPAVGAVLAAGTSVTATVSFSPTATVSSSGSLSMTGAGVTRTVSFTGAGAAPPGVLSVSPTTLDFGSAIVGTSTSRTLTVANTGGSALTVLSVGALPAGFSATGLPAAGASLAPGASLVATLTFAPTAAGIANASVTIATSVGSSTVSLAGTGTARPGELTVTPSAIDLGVVLAGQAVTRDVTITNAGGSPLTLDSIAVSGPPYAVTGQPAPGASLAPGASVVVSVSFAPTADGTFADALTVVSSVGTATVSLTGVGQTTPGELSVSPLAVDAGVVTTGSVATRTVTVSNTGAGPLTVVSAAPPAAPFTVTGLPAAGASLAPGASVTLTVTFAPTAAGAAADTITLVTNGGTATVALAGTGVAPPGLLTLSPSAVDAGAVVVGSSVTRTATIANTGGSDLTISSIASPSAPFSVLGLPAAGAVVPPGTALTVTVVFAPTAEGPASDLLTVVSSAGTATLTLAGVGAPPPAVLSVSPTALAFGTVTTGTSATRTFTVANTGGSPLTITSVSGPGAPFSAAGLPAAGSTLAPGASAVVTVTYSPSTAGPASGSIAVVTPVGSSTVALTGTAVAPPGVLTVSPTAVDHGSVLVGKTRTRTVTIANTGAGPLTITSVSAPTAPFSAAGLPAAGTVLAAGQSVTATLTYAPTQPVVSSGSFTLVSSGGTVTTPLTGTGLAGTVLPPPTAGGWRLNGSATLTGTGATALVRLTATSANQRGSAFYPTVVSSSAVDATFDTTITGGTGGNGLTFVLADPAAGATPASLGNAGTGLGYVGIPGIAVGITTTPTSAVGIAVGGTAAGPTWQTQTTAVPAFRTGVHRVRVVVLAGTMTVSVDGAVVLTGAVTLPPTVLVGFTAGTGASTTDRHSVGAVAITAAPAPAALLSVTPAAVDFGSITTGTSTTRSVVVANLGNSPLTITSTTGPSAPFSATGLPAAGATLAPGASVTATLTFAPAAPGAAAGSVTVVSSVGTATATVTGVAVAPPAVLSVTPTTVAFGVVPRGTTARATVTVANTGGSPLTITSVSALSAPYALSGAPPAGTVLAPGQSVVLTVSFTPTVTTTRRATLTIATSAGNASVALSGSGS